MTDRYTTVGRLASAGFVVGGDPQDACAQCPHAWGEHVLATRFETPMDGGTIDCPDCTCIGTWDVPMHNVPFRITDASLVDDAIEEWHEGGHEGGLPLSSYLGWTSFEYSRWAETGEMPT